MFGLFKKPQTSQQVFITSTKDVAGRPIMPVIVPAPIVEEPKPIETALEPLEKVAEVIDVVVEPVVEVVQPSIDPATFSSSSSSSAEPDRTLAQLVEHSPDKGKVTGPSPVRPIMKAAQNTLLSMSRSVSNEKLYGALDYYIGKTTQRNRIIDNLCDYIVASDKEWGDRYAAIELQHTARLAEKDQEIAALKEQQMKLVDKLIG